MKFVRQLRRRRVAASVTVACAIVLSLLLAGCTSRITPPHVAAQPLVVYLADHGRTSSIIIPTGDGTMVRYAYGDWQWYALNRTGAWRGIAAVLWPTRSTFGRRELEGAGSAAEVRRGVRVPIDALHAIVVEQSAADALRARLDALHAERASLGPAVCNDANDLHMVTYPRRYHAFFNSNHATATWLREMGVRVSRPTIFSKWRVQDE